MADSVGLSGSAEITANFGTGTVSGRVSHMRQDGFINTNTDILMNGTISGNTYSGSAGLVDAGTNTAVGGTTRSTHSGGFYGANAGEVAGALTIEAATNPGLPRFGVGTGRVAVTGAYGGKKQ